MGKPTHIGRNHCDRRGFGRLDHRGRQRRKRGPPARVAEWRSLLGRAASVPIGTTGSCGPGALTGNIREPSTSTTTQSMRECASISAGQLGRRPHRGFTLDVPNHEQGRFETVELRPSVRVVGRADFRGVAHLFRKDSRRGRHQPRGPEAARRARTSDCSCPTADNRDAFANSAQCGGGSPLPALLNGIPLIGHCRKRSLFSYQHAFG